MKLDPTIVAAVLTPDNKKAVVALLQHISEQEQERVFPLRDMTAAISALADSAAQSANDIDRLTIDVLEGRVS